MAYIEKIKKENMVLNTIYVFEEQDGWTAKALASDGQVFAINVPLSYKEKHPKDQAVLMVCNSLDDLLNGGDGMGSTKKDDWTKRGEYKLVNL